MPFLFKNYSFVKVIYVLIRNYKINFFLKNTNNTDRNDVNKKTPHNTKHAEKGNDVYPPFLTQTSLFYLTLPF